jgi:hypothetical protein
MPTPAARRSLMTASVALDIRGLPIAFSCLPRASRRTLPTQSGHQPWNYRAVWRVTAVCVSRRTDHQEHKHRRDDGKGQGNAQHPSDDAGCLALPGFGRGLDLGCRSDIRHGQRQVSKHHVVDFRKRMLGYVGSLVARIASALEAMYL